MRSAVDIQADLDAAYAARRTALSAQNYSLNTGQGSQAVTRADLQKINETIDMLEAELERASDPAGGIIAAVYRRSL